MDEAFQGLFARVAAGEAPGYPRSKAKKRYRSVSYDAPTSWSLRRSGTDRAAMYVQGVGEMALSEKAAHQLRSLLDRGGHARTLTITK